MGFDREPLAEEAELQAACRKLAERYDGTFTVDQDIVAPPPEEAAVYYASIETPRKTYTGQGPTLHSAMLALIDKLT